MQPHSFAYNETLAENVIDADAITLDDERNILLPEEGVLLERVSCWNMTGCKIRRFKI